MKSMFKPPHLGEYVTRTRTAHIQCDDTEENSMHPHSEEIYLSILINRIM